MTKTATRDANTIVTIAESILASDGHGRTFLFVDDRAGLIEIRRLAKGLDASTGRRDSSTKSRRSKSAKSGSVGRKATK